MSVLVRSTRLPRPAIKPAEVRRRAERMLAALGRPGAELSVLLCDDSLIAELNGRYRDKPRPTDVLAFPLSEGEGAEHAGALLGDVVISIDTARRQAADRGYSVAEEVTALLAHGLLHLLGHDHRTRAEERRMNAMADGLRAAARARGDRPTGRS